jgi:hypothetical protein
MTVSASREGLEPFRACRSGDGTLVDARERAETRRKPWHAPLLATSPRDHGANRRVGKLTIGDAVMRGAITGAVIGILIGWLFVLFSWFDPLFASGWLIFDGFWFGTLVGALMGLFLYFATRSQRRFEAVPSDGAAALRHRRRRALRRRRGADAPGPQPADPCPGRAAVDRAVLRAVGGNGAVSPSI